MPSPSFSCAPRSKLRRAQLRGGITVSLSFQTFEERSHCFELRPTRRVPPEIAHVARTILALSETARLRIHEVLHSPEQAIQLARLLLTALSESGLRCSVLTGVAISGHGVRGELSGSSSRRRRRFGFGGRTSEGFVF